jgi:peptidoglycan/xylan/chitin deacetylase (PgdA/CDA1 family)
MGKRVAGFLILAIFVLVGCQSINRTAKQVLPQGYVIFTFDDGPNAHNDTTAHLLDVLQKYHIQAMFALLGENTEYNPDLVKRMKDEGHCLINHGYSDKWVVSMGKEEFRINLEKGKDAIVSALKDSNVGEFDPLLYRPQGGFYKRRHQQVWEEDGYTMVPVTARPYDAVLSASKRERVIKKTVRTIEKQGGGIILLHDARDSHPRMESFLDKKPSGPFNRSWIPDAVEEIIIRLQKGHFFMSGFDDLEVIGRRD